MVKNSDSAKTGSSGFSVPYEDTFEVTAFVLNCCVFLSARMHFLCCFNVRFGQPD